MKDYQTSILMSTSRPILFSAISENLAEWWGKQDNIIDQAKVVFKVSWGEPWYEFKVIHFERNKEMVWECIDANQKIVDLENIEKEWVGTKIIWTLTKLSDARTELQFKHEGLVPELLCFDFCSKSWDHFLKESLVKYVENK